MKSKISQVITGTTLLVVAVVSTIHSTNLHSQALTQWMNSDEGYNSYQAEYALAGTEFAFLGIICFLVGFVFLLAGLFKPVSNSGR
jgi:hypothetical protein